MKNCGRWERLRRPNLSLALLGLLIASLCLGCPAQSDPLASGFVAQVRDGDSIVLSDGREVRYLGIDTPEMGSQDPRKLALARQAKQINSDLTQGVKLRLEFDLERYDQYNRHLAYVFLPDGRLLNAELVRRGLAHVLIMPPNLHYRDVLLDAQRQAIEQRLGLWRELPTPQESHYLGNMRSFRFHRPTCPGAKSMSPSNRRIFKTPLEAYQEGYSPSKDCQP